MLLFRCPVSKKENSLGLYALFYGGDFLIMASFPLFYDFVSWRRKWCNYKMKVVNYGVRIVWKYLAPVMSEDQESSICGFAETLDIADGSCRVMLSCFRLLFPGEWYLVRNGLTILHYPNPPLETDRPEILIQPRQRNNKNRVASMREKIAPCFFGDLRWGKTFDERWQIGERIVRCQRINSLPENWFSTPRHHFLPWQTRSESIQ